MLKIIGICLLLFTSIFAVSELSRVEKTRVCLLKEIHGFLKHVRRQVSCYLLPLGEIASSYSSVRLESCGFLKKIRLGENPAQALVGKYRLSEKATVIISGVFSSFGQAYADDEISALDEAILGLSSVLADEEAECKKRVKLYSVLCTAVGMGTLILVL